jgi:uncharacterized protein DUF6776
MDIPGKLVVRTYAPARRWITFAILLLLAGLALYVMFELGRFKAGYDALQAAAQRDDLQQQIEKLERTQRELRVQLAAAEQARLGEGRERAEVARTIGELQAQVARDQQQMGFYRGLVAQPGQPAADSVQVLQFRIAQLPGDQHFALRFNLSRQQRPEEAVNGTLVLTVDGSRDGAAASIDLAALTGGKNELAFNFRYFDAIEQPITLPPEFKPDRVTIEVRPGRKGMAPYQQTFVWNVEPSS